MLFSDYLIAIMLLRRSVCSFVAQRSVASIIELFSLYYFWLYSNRDYLANQQAKLLFVTIFNRNYV